MFGLLYSTASPYLRVFFDVHCRSILRCTTSNLSRHLSVSASIACHSFLCHKVTKVIIERGCYIFVVLFCPPQWITDPLLLLIIRLIPHFLYRLHCCTEHAPKDVPRFEIIHFIVWNRYKLMPNFSLNQHQIRHQLRSRAWLHPVKNITTRN